MILSLVVLTLFFAVGIPRIKFDMSMEAFFRTDDPALHSYDVFHFLFGGDQYLIMMFKPADGDVFSQASLQQVKELEDDLNNQRIKSDSVLNRITRVRSIYSADLLEVTDNALINRKFVGENGIPQTQQQTELLRELAVKQRDYPGNLFSKNSKLGILIVQTDYGSRLKIVDSDKNNQFQVEQELDTEEIVFDFEADIDRPSGLSLNPNELPKYETPEMPEYTEFMTAFREVLHRNNWQTGLQQQKGVMGYLAVGNPWMMDFFNREVLTEMGMYSILSILLILLILYFVIGSLPGMIWPTLIIGIGIVWTMGLIGWSGVAVNMLINVIVFLILTVGVAASIHILSGYKQYRQAGIEHQLAMTKTFRKTGLPIFLAALTTIAGMLSMSIVPIAPIQTFAGFAATSVVVTFILTLFYLPVGMNYWAPKITNKNEKSRRNRTDELLQQLLMKIDYLGKTYPKKIVLLFVVAGAVAIAGLPKVHIDTNVATIIKEGAGLREALFAIDNNFGGTSTAEILIDSGEADGIKDPELLKAIDSLENKIKTGRPDLVNQVDSIVKLAKQSYQNMSDGSEENYRIPDDADILSQTLFGFESADPSTRKLFVDDEWQVARLTIKVITKGSSEYETFTDEINGWIDESFAVYKLQNPQLKTSVTGSIPLMMTMMAFISEAQLRSYVLVVFVIAVLLLLIFGSVKFGVIAIIPNIFPIVVLMGVTGWAGIALDIDTLLVMPLAIGIAVDDSIHFLTHYRTELLNGKSSKAAIKSSLEKVGQAMIYTSIVLSLGFLVFLLSIHQGLSNFGVLAAIAMFSALLADLLLLPAMIYTFKPFSQ